MLLLEDMPLDPQNAEGASASCLIPVPVEEAVAKLRVTIGTPRLHKRTITASLQALILPPGLRDVSLPGVRLTVSWTGDVQVSLPPAVAWEQSLSWLPRAVRKRVLSIPWRRMFTEHIIARYRQKHGDRPPNISQLRRRRGRRFWTKC